MTHKRLQRELGVGELAYWRATLDREYERFKQAQKEAAKKAKAGK